MNVQILLRKEVTIWCCNCKSHITEDPSCGVVMRVANTAGTTILDESTTCRGQSRGLDVPSGASALESLQWNLTDQSGDLVPAGMYTLLVELAGSGLSSSVDVMVQQQSNLRLNSNSVHQ